MKRKKSHMGAGILPYAYKPELVFLLGQENKGNNPKRNELYCDFGGGAEKGETPTQTAYREFKEETMNAVGNNRSIKRALKNPTIKYIAKNKYHAYVIPIAYNRDLPHIYNRIMKELEKCMSYKKYKNYKHLTVKSCPVGLCEKMRLKWFTPSEIIQNKHKMRPIFYRTFIKIIKKLNK